MSRIILPVRQSLFILSVIALLLLPLKDEAQADMESFFLYFPDPHLHMTPGNVGLDFEEVTFPAEDGTLLHGWYVPGGDDKPVVLFFHGNAGNISHRVDNLALINRTGLSVFIFDYRGYGRSQGNTIEKGVYSDARGALSWLTGKGYDQKNIIYFGRSLGAAVALQLALEEPPLALIMESPFTSVAGMGKKHYPLLYRILGWMMPADYNNEKKITGLKSPVLIIHGTEDTIVPASMGEELFQLAPEPKKLHLIDGVDHNDGFYLEERYYWNVWNDFLRLATEAGSSEGVAP